MFRLAKEKQAINYSLSVAIACFSVFFHDGGVPAMTGHISSS
jgi:hypothetical protein